MTFRWQYRPAVAGAGPDGAQRSGDGGATVTSGAPAAGTSTGPGSVGPAADQSFVSQSDAESWLGENWRDLAADGVEEVVLLDGGTAVYEMSLSEF